MEDPICPACDSDVPIDSKAERAASVYCPYCGMPLRVKLKDESWQVEEDF